jgi:HEAT repeat protein
MKSLPRVFVLLSVSLTLASLLVACGEKGSQFAEVDVDTQVQNLKSPDPEQRANAAAALGSAGPNAAPAVPHLIEALKDSDALVRRLSAYALGQMGPAAREAIPALQGALDDSDPAVIPAAVNALRAIDTDTFGAMTVTEMRKQAPR